MLDTKFILQNLDAVKQAVADKKVEPHRADVDRLVEMDRKRRESQTKNDQLANEKNKLSKQFGMLKGQEKKAGPDELAGIQAEQTTLMARIKEIDEQTQVLAQVFAEADAAQDEIRSWIPNLPHESVPPGASSEDNVVAREWGADLKRKFPFKPRYQYELGADLGILDTERGGKVSGTGWYFLRGDGARLERALITWFLDVHRANGYTELIPPFFVSEKTLYGSGQLPKFGDQMYYAKADDLYAIPTAEVPVTAYHRDEMLAENALPLRYAAWSGCFRREAGAAGADTRGILRVHQFNKVEMLWCAHPDRSIQDLETLTGHGEYLLQQLGLPYRVLTLCRGDLGFSSAKTYDLEVWAPVTAKWLEVSSCSNFSDYQARRSNLRFKPADGGKPRFVHTLNGSGLALPRIQAALWETYQQADGSIEIPAVLRPYLGGQERIEATK